MNEQIERTYKLKTAVSVMLGDTLEEALKNFSENSPPYFVLEGVSIKDVLNKAILDIAFCFATAHVNKSFPNLSESKKKNHIDSYLKSIINDFYNPLV